MLNEIIDFFDCAYVINLRTRPDKKKEVIRQFNRFGIDLPNDKVEFYLTDRPQEMGYFRSTGQRGCYTSHLNLLNMALENNKNNILVFEDDVCFRKSHLNKFANITQELSQLDWDIVYFGYRMPEIKTRESGFIEWLHLTEGGQFYGVNREFMERMAKYMAECADRPKGHPEGGAGFRDVAYNNFRMNNAPVKTYLHVPNLAGQSGFQSDLHAVRVLERYQPAKFAFDVYRQMRSRWLGR